MNSINLFEIRLLILKWDPNEVWEIDIELMHDNIVIFVLQYLHMIDLLQWFELMCMPW